MCGQRCCAHAKALKVASAKFKVEVGKIQQGNGVKRFSGITVRVAIANKRFRYELWLQVLKSKQTILFLGFFFKWQLFFNEEIYIYNIFIILL